MNNDSGLVYNTGSSVVVTECQSCHGSNYTGGRSGSSCYDCHPGSNGPQSCNVCHGNSQNAAPPEDLNNKTSVSEIGVGAHQVMITSLTETDPGLTVQNVCSICHTLPSSVSSPGHISRSPSRGIEPPQVTREGQRGESTPPRTLAYDSPKMDDTVPR